MIGLVHLVWAPLGVPALARFASAYREHPPGVEHELIIVFNGFSGPQDADAHRAVLAGLDHRELVLDRPVQDLLAYHSAARQLDHDELCFVNSHARPLADDWLLTLQRGLHRPGVGMAGASGTYETHLDGAARGGEPGERLLWLRRRIAVRRLRSQFPPFPNPHLRTSTFAARRELLLELGLERALDKDAAHRLESGWDSLTRQLSARGLQTVVTGRGGGIYPPRQWPASRTYRSGEQENLLVADNRTDEYQQADPRERADLARLAWGR